MSVLESAPVCLLAAVVTLGCSEPNVPTASTERGSINLSTSEHAGPSANGQALFTFFGEKQTFAFHARELKDGTVKGSYEVRAHAFDIRLHGNIDCLSISGNSAIMSGVVTHSNFPPFPVGIDAWFRVVDNGEGANAPADEWTDLFVFSTNDCTSPEPFDGFPAPLIPIEAGNIQVKP